MAKRPAKKFKKKTGSMADACGPNVERVERTLPNGVKEVLVCKVPAPRQRKATTSEKLKAALSVLNEGVATYRRFKKLPPA